MDEALQAIIEEVGKLSDVAEKDKWAVSEAVSTAFAEFPAYTRGLTAGLCSRLRKSTDSIYGLRDAWNLRSLLDVSDSLLSVSHFAALSRLRDRYNLADESCREWIAWAEENEISVREMSIEISTRHTQDARAAFLRRCGKVLKSLIVLYEDSESVSLPQSLRVLLRGALEAVQQVMDDWGN